MSEFEESVEDLCRQRLHQAVRRVAAAEAELEAAQAEYLQAMADVAVLKQTPF